MNTMIDWPPEVTLKKNPRSKHIKLKASLQEGLTLIVPPRFNAKDIPFLLAENRVWIEKQLAKIYLQRANKNFLPENIEFPALKQIWRIDYIFSTTKLKLIKRPQQFNLVLMGNIQQILSCKKILLAWIRETAGAYLLSKLNEISQEIHLPFSMATIRDQTSRWGSCSAEKAINLNFKLIFLPEKLIRHVLIHELCHTVHMNHSEKFWQLVATFDSEWEIHKRMLRKTESFIPAWILQ